MKKNQVNTKKNSSRNNQMMDDDLFQPLPLPKHYGKSSKDKTTWEDYAKEKMQEISDHIKIGKVSIEDYVNAMIINIYMEESTKVK